MCAADRDNLDVFLLLEQRGANLLLKDNEDDTVFMKAVDAALDGRDQIFNMIRKRAKEIDESRQGWGPGAAQNKREEEEEEAEAEAAETGAGVGGVTDAETGREVTYTTPEL